MKTKEGGNNEIMKKRMRRNKWGIEEYGKPSGNIKTEAGQRTPEDSAGAKHPLVKTEEDEKEEYGIIRKKRKY